MVSSAELPPARAETERLANMRKLTPIKDTVGFIHKSLAAPGNFQKQGWTAFGISFVEIYTTLWHTESSIFLTSLHGSFWPAFSQAQVYFKMNLTIQVPSRSSCISNGNR